jgi:hypothetical protein
MLMKTKLSAAIAATSIAAIISGVIAAPALAASKKAVVAPPPNQAAPFIGFGGAFGRYFPSDGSQQWLGRTVAGAAPNILATAAGVRCEYRYIVQNGQRIKYEYCD